MTEIILALIVGALFGVIFTALLRKDGKDTDRLDFISNTGCDIVFNADRGLWGVVDIHKRVATDKSLRSAIDKAEVTGIGDYA